MEYELLKNKSSQLKSVAGINEEQFNLLHNSYSIEWLKYIDHYTLSGKVRYRSYRPRKDEKLGSTEDQLLFILYYLKGNLLQEHLASVYGMHQSQANLWIHLLLKLLHKTLHSMQQMPCRNALKIMQVLENVEKVYIDATEREIQRPSDNVYQKECYSGKKSGTALRMPLFVLKRIK